MAQFIRLAVNLQEGRNLDTPDVVYKRYIKNGIGGQTGYNITAPSLEDLSKLKAGESFTIKGTAAPGSTVAYLLGEQRQSAKTDAGGNFTLTAKMPEARTPGFLAVLTPDNSSFISSIPIGGLPTAENFPPELIENIENAKTSPIFESGKTILFYRGAAKTVSVAGDITGWNPQMLFMKKIGENLHAIVLDLAPTARVEYKLVVDGKWILDPLNPNKMDNGVGGENSYFTMPEYKPTVWDKEIEKSLLMPDIAELEIESPKFGKRTVKIYVPSEYYKRGIAPKLPVLYLFDGGDYIRRAGAINVLENLIAAKKVEPFMLVFTDPKERTKEYWANDDFADYIANEVVPAVEKKYFSVVKTGRENRALLGASLGGITSVWIGLKHPDKFARIGGQSSSFWVDNERVIEALKKLDATKTKFTFYFDDGAFEGTEDSRRVNVLLRGKGFPVTYIEGETGHTWTSWRDRLADAFIALWK